MNRYMYPRILQVKPANDAQTWSDEQKQFFANQVANRKLLTVVQAILPTRQIMVDLYLCTGQNIADILLGNGQAGKVILIFIIVL